VGAHILPLWSPFQVSPLLRERLESVSGVRKKLGDFFFLFLRVSSYKKCLTSVLKIKSAIKMIQMFAIKTRKTINYTQHCQGCGETEAVMCLKLGI